MSNKKDEIEVLGLTEDKDYTKPIKVVAKRSKKYEDDIKDDDIKDDENKKIPKKRKLKKGVLQKSFWAFSILVIVVCCVFYGIRLVKYYRIYNPKESNESANLGDRILKDSKVVTSGEGLYKISGNYIYKGSEVNNYIKYGNLLWRIVKIGSDGKVDIILDNSINSISFDSAYSDYVSSDINSYLNKVFVKNINTEKLDKTSVCKDLVNDVNNTSCNDVSVDNYVKLIDVSTFLNSKVNDVSYISDEYTNNIWTSSVSKNKVWTINGLNLTEAMADEAYFVKPMVTLKSNNKILKGDGSYDEPYEIEKKKGIGLGDYVQLGDDTYIAYEINGDNVKLQAKSASSIGLNAFSDGSVKYDVTADDNIANYLNGEFYNDLSYKSKLVKASWDTGKYNGKYNSVYKSKVESYVGMLSVNDLKFGDEYGYYLITPISNTKVYVYEEELKASLPNVAKNIRPTICINKSVLKSGKGTLNNPYKGSE